MSRLQDGGFNSRAHVGRDGARGQGQPGVQVSIHAPTWGATHHHRPRRQARRVSIHAPTWGATGDQWSVKGGIVVFQFTRPRGARHAGLLAWIQGRDEFQFTRPRGARPRRWRSPPPPRVSIHAPTWGATTRLSRPRRKSGFQFTRPRGARLRRDGEDAAPVGVSIHAPTWGATLGMAGLQIGAVVSIHAPTWGATTPAASTRTGERFQFTRPRGARHARRVDEDGGAVSIHAPTWGATRAARTPAARGGSFNSRAHVGRDAWR